MDAKKCDRCGKYYDGPKGKRLYKMERFNVCNYFIVDLCEECHDGLANFMKYGEVNKWIPDEPDGNYVEPGLKTIP